MAAAACVWRAAAAGAAETAHRTDPYNVVWRTPSKDAAGSMPLGNGSTGLNAWVEPGGDLLFYISRTDSWGDNGRLLKVGLVRIALDPPPSTASPGFRQTLRLSDATMVVRYGEGAEATSLRLWADANHPVIHVAIDSPKPVAATASIELWRTRREQLPNLECSDVLNRDPQKRPTVVEPDTVLAGQTGRIGWCHRNSKSVGPAVTGAVQGLEGFARPDPLLGRTFGAVIRAEGGRRRDDLHLVSPPSAAHRFDIYVLTRHPATVAEWLAAVDKTVAATEQVPFARRRQAHAKWWRDFWDRSWICATSAGPPQTPGAEKSVEAGGDAAVVSRAYALQRFITACAGRGAYPIKFNGTLFTVPYPGRPGDADYRRWGPGYWWQNTRLPYISLCTSGDFDLMQPLFAMYGRRLMPLFRFRTRLYLGHDGAYIPECIYFWGDVFSETYGWTPYDRRTDRLQASRWHKWEWVSGPELVWMMLDYYDHTLDEAFLSGTLLPTAHEILTFFDRQYKVGARGKLVMHPAQACETWWDCTNAMPEVAGLHAACDRLLALPARLTTGRQRAFWTALQKKLPDLPTREVDGTRMLAPAERFAMKHNCENPELYAVFPFRRIALGRPGVELGIEALRHRWDKGDAGWRQDVLFMAYLGLAGDARRSLVARARKKHAGSRFPAFWGPNYDWVPDQDHGGVLMKALQAMLLQSDGRTIYLLPAWPKDWDVAFRLHAPYKTTLQGAVRGGKVRVLEVTPPERRADLVIGEPQ